MAMFLLLPLSSHITFHTILLLAATTWADLKLSPFVQAGITHPPAPDTLGVPILGLSHPDSRTGWLTLVDVIPHMHTLAMLEHRSGLKPALVAGPVILMALIALCNDRGILAPEGTHQLQ